jgi:hypothetical protein
MNEVNVNCLNFYQREATLEVLSRASAQFAVTTFRQFAVICEIAL